MLRPVIVAAALASATAFAPTVGVVPRLRSAPASNVQMAMQPQGKVSRAGFVSGLATAAVIAGLNVMPADASINSQMSMDSNSFSVLSDNQKVYKSTGITENPYLSEAEKMKQLEKLARLEDCERVKSKSVCLSEEDNRTLAESGVKKRGNPVVTVGLPVVLTSGFSFALLKFLNK